MTLYTSKRYLRSRLYIKEKIVTFYFYLGLHEELEDLDFNDIAENDDEENGYIPDDSKMVFMQHEGSIFSVNLTVGSDLAVSGGEDDKGFVWNTSSGETLFECTGHKDSVIGCGFSPDNKYVMTADMSGTVIVRTVSDGNKVWEFDCSDIEWCIWHSSANVLFSGTTEGGIYMWRIPGGDCKIYQGHGFKSVAGCLLSSGKQLFAGYGDGSSKLWDLKNATVLFQYHADEEDPVICVDSQKNGNLIACGTQLGNIKLFSSLAGKLVALFSVPPAMESDDTSNESTVESIAFSPTEQYIASGSLNGSLLVWDITTKRLRHELKLPGGISHIIWHETNPNILITASLDGVVRQWNTRNGEMIKELNGHTKDILDIVLSSDGKTILTAGDDGTARIFEK